MEQKIKILKEVYSKKRKKKLYILYILHIRAGTAEENAFYFFWSKYKPCSTYLCPLLSELLLLKSPPLSFLLQFLHFLHTVGFLPCWKRGSKNNLNNHNQQPKWFMVKAGVLLYFFYRLPHPLCGPQPQNHSFLMKTYIFKNSLEI